MVLYTEVHSFQQIDQGVAIKQGIYAVMEVMKVMESHGIAIFFCEVMESHGISMFLRKVMEKVMEGVFKNYD